ncbi:GDP-mannose 4,6-dehydratase [Symmachiella macrocystis]|uniref:GDP-mannose 4,6-dehydratase n=1 Tax=Symmachiella macrocystis TaxID=2527985 RepID=A0A5C6BED1_9PLAN|nr:GDP-mannose 4,6-dehydratase [Symmachiella macrocystis]TWU09629.1 GDP-mannose 4,6-dehydratase [Symmachiella macrocystis]
MSENRCALITGITGQDGSYLAELLVSKGYEVHGLIRRSSTTTTGRIAHLMDAAPGPGSVELHYGDLSDSIGLNTLILDIEPDEIYNLAAQSHVRVSFDKPLYTMDITGVGALRILEVARQLARRKEVRVYQASSSEMFGAAPDVPQNEFTTFRPQSPYACAKVYAYYQTINYREAYDLYACNGILFNHESPRRGEQFVTRKITRAVGRIMHGFQDKLFLGNLDAKRDWGYAKDYVEAMWLMLQQDEPDDFVIATGESHSIRDCLEIAFDRVNLNWEDYVEIDPRFFRPTDVSFLQGDCSKARESLGWEPSTPFEELIRIMVDADCDLAARERALEDMNANTDPRK